MRLRFVRRRRRQPGQTEEEIQGAATKPADWAGSGAGLPVFLQGAIESPRRFDRSRAPGYEAAAGVRPFQAKLTVGEPGDHFEQEADRASEAAIDAPRPVAFAPSSGSRTPAALGGALPAEIDGAMSGEGGDLALDQPAQEAGSSRPLPPGVRRLLELRLGADFSSVRVHDDGHASDLARTIGAEAFTTGHDIYFGAGRFRPDSKPGLKLIAHELAHVVQQDPSLARSGGAGFAARAIGPTGAGGIQRQFGFLADPLAGVFDTVVATNILAATPIAIPEHFIIKLVEFAQDNPVDGVILILGFIRAPVYYSGGWILDIQTNAKAMTLDRSVFVDGALDIGTYIHEMVHVQQYGLAGRIGFLTSYFGLSAATIAWRFINREPLDVMRSSPHENQAYDLEARFMTWYKSHP